MNDKSEPKYHFSQLTSKRSETPDQKGLKKLCYVSQELNNELHLFLWVDQYNDVEKFQFFFSEKVVEWSRQNGLTTNITNRLDSTATQGKIGVHKGIRTLTLVNDPSMLEEALDILNQSVFPLGIKDILITAINKTMSSKTI